MKSTYLTEDGDYPLDKITSNLINVLQPSHRLERTRKAMKRNVQNSIENITLEKGAVHLVADEMVRFGADDDSFRQFHKHRPCLIIDPPNALHRHEAVHVPGSSKLIGRDPKTTVLHGSTAFLLQYYDRLHAKSYGRKVDMLPPEKIEEVEKKWKTLE